MSRRVAWTRSLPARILLGLCLCGPALSSCKTDPRPEAARFASIELQGNTPGQIANVATAVFRDHGYKAVQTGYANLVFEKEASRMDNVAYGDWLADKPVWIRVKAAIVPLAEARFRLQCQAFLVKDKNEAMEEELKVKFRSGPYQKLLDEIGQRLTSRQN